MMNRSQAETAPIPMVQFSDTRGGGPSTGSSWCTITRSMARLKLDRTVAVTGLNRSHSTSSGILVTTVTFAHLAIRVGGSACPGVGAL